MIYYLFGPGSGFISRDVGASLSAVRLSCPKTTEWNIIAVITCMSHVLRNEIWS